MVRISKDPEVRRQEILDAAISVFAEKGYARSTVDDIRDRAGIAKGTFYYYFASKDEVMRAIVEYLVDAAVARAEAAAADRGRPVADRCLAVIGSQRADGDQAALLDALHEPGNAEFHVLSHLRLIAGITPVLAAVVRDGVADGTFNTAYPGEATAILLTSASFLTDEGFDDSERPVPWNPDRMVAAILEAAERVLGAAPGTFTSRAEVLQTHASADPTPRDLRIEN